MNVRLRAIVNRNRKHELHLGRSPEMRTASVPITKDEPKGVRGLTLPPSLPGEIIDFQSENLEKGSQGVDTLALPPRGNDRFSVRKSRDYDYM